MFSCPIGPIYRMFVPGETRGAAKASSCRLTPSSKLEDCGELLLAMAGNRDCNLGDTKATTTESAAGRMRSVAT
jgi:hypothetical protein